MKKIEALKEILNTRGVGYHTGKPEAMWCGGYAHVEEYLTNEGQVSGTMALTLSGCELLEEGWEVVPSWFDSVNDFEFPKYRNLTIEEAFKMLSLPEEERRVEYSDGGTDWGIGTLDGVYADGCFSIVGLDGFRVDWKYCRVCVEEDSDEIIMAAQLHEEDEC